MLGKIRISWNTNECWLMTAITSMLCTTTWIWSALGLLLAGINCEFFTTWKVVVLSGFMKLVTQFFTYLFWISLVKRSRFLEAPLHEMKTCMLMMISLSMTFTQILLFHDNHLNPLLKPLKFQMHAFLHLLALLRRMLRRMLKLF